MESNTCLTASFWLDSNVHFMPFLFNREQYAIKNICMCARVSQMLMDIESPEYTILLISETGMRLFSLLRDFLKRHQV